MSKSAQTFHLPQSRLPEDQELRREFLEGYFGDLIPTSIPGPEGWQVDLHWPDDESFFVDPLLRRHLDWWRVGTPFSGIREQVVGTDTGQLSLDDAWTLFGWSRWLHARHARGCPPSDVAIIHVDDHRDMMSPRIGWDGAMWRDLLSGEPFSVHDPSSVRAAILNGAVGIGSFFAPFLQELPSVIVRHLCQSAALAEDGRESTLCRQTVLDTVLQPGHLRPAVAVIPDDSHAGAVGGVMCGTYRFSRSLEWCLSGLPECPVLLHIDMDYFNNRYDRDSDWRERPGRHDPCTRAILESVDELFAALHDHRVVDRIENVTVALSPGFFPSEFWPAGIERVEHHLAKMGFRLRWADEQAAVIRGST